MSDYADYLANIEAVADTIRLAARLEQEPWPLQVCQASPRCPLKGAEVHAAQLAGCVWCAKICVTPEGRVDIAGPGNA